LTITRECQEEVGIIPNKLVKLVEFYPNPGRIDWPMQLYYCDDYKEAKTDFYDASEDTERVVMSIAKLQSLIDEGKIVDPSLLIAWYTARHKGYILDSEIGL
jgi:ADP-ribose pyrophosphatase